MARYVTINLSNGSVTIKERTKRKDTIDSFVPDELTFELPDLSDELFSLEDLQKLIKKTW